MNLPGWLLFALGSAFFASLTAIFGKIGVVTLRSEWRRPDSLDGRSLVALVLSGIATGLSWLCYYRALELGPASRVAPIDKLSVAFVIILAFFVLGEAFTWRTMLGTVLIVAGSVVIAL